MTSKALTHVEYSQKYGQKTARNTILIKPTIFWPYLCEYPKLVKAFDVIL
jgi:hypothetical protein